VAIDDGSFPPHVCRRRRVMTKAANGSQQLLLLSELPSYGIGVLRQI
jgi:hypothetical protein